MVLLSIVVVRNMTAVSWKIDHFFEMVPDLAMVVLGELLVDWLKHAFITKFNEIPAEVYKDFTITIAYDVVKSRDEDAFSDHSDQVSRRMGFIPIPLSILLIRIFTQSLSFSSRQGFVLLALAWVALATLKILNSIVLLGKACKYIAEYERMQQQTELLQRMRIRKSKSVPASPRMSLIDFSDVMQQNPGGTKGFTVSDLLAHLDEIAAQQQQQNQQQGSPVEKIATVEYKTPRRSQSLANCTFRCYSRD
uniref:Uncharacterized protein n=2 Tax=Plectus sambesii TaxID=2011161 RepID=A0A914VZ59_9BILA